MDQFDVGFGDDFASADERLALDLAREDQRLILRLIEIRRSQGKSQEDLADMLGISQATISAFERPGNDPKMSTVRRYARALGVMVRHHADENAGCGDSQFIAHVTETGISTHQTAAAIRRTMGPVRSPSWPELDTGKLAARVGERTAARVKR